MDDLATLNARPRPMMLGGESYDIHPLTLGDFADLQRFVESQFPDPIAAAKANLDGLPMAVQQYLLKEALAIAARPKPRLGTPEADAILQSLDGVREILFLSIRKGRPAFTRTDAAALYDRIGMDDIGRVFKDTNAEMVLSDPN